MRTFYHYYNSPFGRLLLAGDDIHLSLLGFPAGAMARQHFDDWIENPKPFKEAVSQLESYFVGELREFKLKLDVNGTDFQQNVWSALASIPYGQTWTYGQLAKHIGKPRASRAVGAANGANPLPIIIPCHRVVAAGGKLGGFGGGLEMKNSLLTLESKFFKQQ
jgi:methylated-DNA-[protein]-cysteine S-methyltransferase